MKHLKKFFAMLLTVAMVLAMTVTAFADGETPTTYKITIKNTTTGHTYEVYQIFTGDLSTNEDGNKVLSNVVWGSSVTKYKEQAVTVGSDVSAVAESLTEKNLETFISELTLGSVFKTAESSKDTTEINELPAGYYLVKDKAKDQLDAYTEYIVQVVGDAEVDVKSDVPEVVKKVKDTNDSTGETSGWQDSADYDIGDSVSFQLTATLADNVSSYNTYKVVFRDTLSAGLTYNGDAAVTFNGTDVTTYFDITEENGTLTISCDNVKEFDATDSSVITVEYTATLNENAVIGSAGNPNKVKLEYSNNPNSGGEGDTGTTPEDTVIVFTYEVIVNKVDGENKPLAGAEFILQKKQADGTYKDIAAVKSNDGTTFTFSGLDDGEYKLVESKTTSGYNTIDTIEFTITAEHEIESDAPSLTSLTVSDNTFTVKMTTANENGKQFPTGTISTDIVNQSGSTLPETGGMGTTIFYILGSILVAGAAVLLITKRRMSAER